jgi:anti-sigma regulatory factor (Ser/Thr protein kinase)
MSKQPTADEQACDTLVHDALLYRGPEQLIGATRRFVELGLKLGEPVLVAVSSASLELLRTSLKGSADRIRFEDMSCAGRNPGRIMTVIQQWSDRHAGRVRFVGEPIWPGRSNAELAEGIRHEALINLAFADAAVTVLCPYDAEQLGSYALASAERTHPALTHADGRRRSSVAYSDPLEVYRTAGRPFTDPTGEVAELSFDDDLFALRRFVAASDPGEDLTPDALADFVFSLNELAANVIRHGHGRGTMRIWREAGMVVGEIAGPGWVTDPLAGCRRPSPAAIGGRGLWLVNQLCDLVELRPGECGTTVRIRMQSGSV